MFASTTRVGLIQALGIKQTLGGLMRWQLLTVLIGLFQIPLIQAQTTPEPNALCGTYDPAAPETAALVTPSLSAIMEAGKKLRLSSVEAEVLIENDASGHISSIVFLKNSGNRRMDQAIESWARSIKLEPGSCGFSTRKIQFTTTVSRR